MPKGGEVPGRALWDPLGGTMGRWMLSGGPCLTRWGWCGKGRELRALCVTRRVVVTMGCGAPVGGGMGVGGLGCKLWAAGAFCRMRWHKWVRFGHGGVV